MPTGVIVSGIRKTIRKKRRQGTCWTASSARPRPRAYWSAIPTNTKMSVTMSAPGRPPSLTRAWTSSQTKPTSMTPPMSRRTSPNGPT